MKSFKQWLFTDPEKGFFARCDRHFGKLCVLCGALLLVVIYLYLNTDLLK